MIKIQSLSHDGRGIATIEEKTSFIEGTLPGETVSCQITQKRSRYNEGRVTEVLDASPERIIPPCEHFGLCGGCNLQHMSIKAQIEFKQQTLLDQLKHFGKVVPETILPPLDADALGYRRKARLGVKFVIKKNKLLVGFREKSSRYLADLQRCVVLHPQVGERFKELANLIMSLSCTQKIPQIEVAIGDNEAALIFRHMEDLTLEDKSKLISFGEQYDFHIYLQPNSPAKVEKLWPEDNKERICYSLPDEDIEFLFHPLDFTQVNLPLNRLMVAQALHLLELNAQDNVLDLFCGIGNFSLPLARHAASVIGIEGSSEMVARAFENAAHNHIPNVHFYAANLAAPPDNAEWIKPYNKILLDPPRVGAKELLPLFKRFIPERIAYISCNPATLARDAGELVDMHGYKLKAAGVMNMFPHTAHIEAMAIFEQN